MTHTQSRELDAEVAEKVMGIKVDYYDDAKTKPCYELDGGHMGVDDVPLPFYSTDTEAAMEVVEKLRADEVNFSLGNGYDGDNYRAWFSERIHPRNSGKCWDADAPTAPLAICLAALKAVKEISPD